MAPKAGTPGTSLQQTLAQAAKDLSELEQKFALVGGLAVSARAEPRFTRDVDLVVAARSDAEVEALMFELQARGYAIDASIEQTRTGRLATVRTRRPEAPALVIDLLFASSGIEPEITEFAEELELFEGLLLPVATRPALVALKVLARGRTRPQDDLDLASLIPGMGAAEVEEVERLLSLISARGYARGKRLVPEFRRIAVKLGAIATLP